MPAAKGFNMIYYVEDDDNIRDLTVYALRKQGIEAEGFSCDGEFKAAVARRVPDAVLLDIMLPDTDGLAIMRRLRADRLTATVPIMMLTAKDTELDKVMALDGGADDYLTKPFSLMELASRCRALLRRGGMVKQASDVLSVGDIVLSPSHREVTVAGEPLKLTLREFDLLEYLMRKPGVVFTRESLLQSVWGWDFDGGSRTVDVHVQTLRQNWASMPAPSRPCAAWATAWLSLLPVMVPKVTTPRPPHRRSNPWSSPQENKRYRTAFCDDLCLRHGGYRGVYGAGCVLCAKHLGGCHECQSGAGNRAHCCRPRRAAGAHPVLA